MVYAGVLEGEVVGDPVIFGGDSELNTGFVVETKDASGRGNAMDSVDGVFLLVMAFSLR